MYLIIDAKQNNNQRKEQITNFLNELGCELYIKCQNADISKDIKDKISISLCIGYAKNQFEDYLNITAKQTREYTDYDKNMFTINITQKHVENIISMATHLLEDSTQTEK